MCLDFNCKGNNPISNMRFFSQNDSKISAVSVSEFATPSAFLSMAVLEAGVKKIKESERGEADANSGSDSDDDDDDDERRELEIEVGHCLITLFIAFRKQMNSQTRS